VTICQQPTTEEGEKVVALIDDETTKKEFYHGNGMIILEPCSSNKEHKSIILSEDFQIRGVVVATIPRSTIEGILKTTMMKKQHPTIPIKTQMKLWTLFSDVTKCFGVIL
jgi:hypothetical protein